MLSTTAHAHHFTCSREVSLIVLHDALGNVKAVLYFVHDEGEEMH